MPIVWQNLMCAILCLLFALPSAAGARDSGAYYDLSEEISEKPSTWADHFARNASVLLGPERRLPNGVRWRLLTDRGTGAPAPRLTWIPDRNRLAVANRLLQAVQGGEMLVVEHERMRLQQMNRTRATMGLPPLDEPAVAGWDVELTYAGERLMSMVANAQIWGEGEGSSSRLQLGLAFDLQTEAVIRLSACPADSGLYGFQFDASSNRQTGRFTFRYGELLDLCDPARYRDFIALVKRTEARRVHRHLDPSPRDDGAGCIEYPAVPVFQEQQEYIAYLTFSGLAVQATGRQCPVARTPDNPVIVPYRALAPFMTDGPWRDELLSLPGGVRLP